MTLSFLEPNQVSNSLHIHYIPCQHSATLGSVQWSDANETRLVDQTSKSVVLSKIVKAWRKYAILSRKRKRELIQDWVKALEKWQKSVTKRVLTIWSTKAKAKRVGLQLILMYKL